MEIKNFEQIPSALNFVIEKINLIENLVRESVPVENTEKILNIQEAADFLHLSVPTIYSKVSKGELPVMKRSKRLYFSRDELVNYLKQGRKKTIDEIEGQDLSELMGKGRRS